MTDFAIGVDISKKHFDAHRSKDGASRQFSNTTSEFRSFIKWVGDTPDRIVYEPTGPYHRAFEGACAKAGLALCKVNPKQARRFAEAIGTLAKTDRVDAIMLARMGTMTEPPMRPVADENLNNIRELNLARRALIKERTATRNRLHTLHNALLKKQHTHRLKQVSQDLKAIDAEIMGLIRQEKQMSRWLDILTGIPGIGQTTAFALIIDMPELGSLDARQAASLAGLAPMTRQSGKWRGRAMINGGRRHLREALYMPAMVAARHNPGCTEKYNDLTARGKPGKVALTAIMRKLLITANALIREGRKWEPKNA